jgi:hypothetical protein
MIGLTSQRISSFDNVATRGTAPLLEKAATVPETVDANPTNTTDSLTLSSEASEILASGADRTDNFRGESLFIISLEDTPVFNVIDTTPLELSHSIKIPVQQVPDSPFHRGMPSNVRDVQEARK